MRRETQELPKPHYRANSVEVMQMDRAIKNSSLGSTADYTSKLDSGHKSTIQEQENLGHY